MTSASASFQVILGEFRCDVILQACRENLLSPSVPNLRRSLVWHETAAALEPNLTPFKREKFARQDICFEIYCSLLEIQIMSVCAQRHCVLLLNLVPCGPRLFKRWIAPSTGLKSIQWKVQLVSLILIHWIVIYPVDNSAIQRLNNLVQASLRASSPIWASKASFARTK